MNLAAGMPVACSSLSAVSGEGLLRPFRMRVICTRDTPTLGANVASVSPASLIQAFRSSILQMYTQRTE